jgi:hypothetical protein
MNPKETIEEYIKRQVKLYQEAQLELLPHLLDLKVTNPDYKPVQEILGRVNVIWNTIWKFKQSADY